MSDDEETKKGVYLFGQDVTQIPCFRNTFLYSISTGLGVGLVCFMFTSKVSKAVNYGYGSFLFTTLSYWFSCRYTYSQRNFELQRTQQLLKQKLLLEGTEADVTTPKEITGTDILQEEIDRMKQ